MKCFKWGESRQNKETELTLTQSPHQNKHLSLHDKTSLNFSEHNKQLKKQVCKRFARRITFWMWLEIQLLVHFRQWSLIGTNSSETDPHRPPDDSRYEQRQEAGRPINECLFALVFSSTYMPRGTTSTPFIPFYRDLINYEGLGRGFFLSSLERNGSAKVKAQS